MKVAIVGTSINLTENEDRDIRQTIALILQKLPKDTIILSGGADGVDSIAVEVSKSMGFQTEVFPPKEQNWESYRERNLEIADACDALYSISVPVHSKECYHHSQFPVPLKHEKTAGCWTMNKARELGKEVVMLVMPSR